MSSEEQEIENTEQQEEPEESEPAPVQPNTSMDVALESMQKFEDELDNLKLYEGINPDSNPFKFINWESKLKARGLRAPYWRAPPKGEHIGYVLVSTNDIGIICILCKADGTCVRIRGYEVSEESKSEKGKEVEMNFDPVGGSHQDLRSAIAEASNAFKTKMDELGDTPPADAVVERDEIVVDNQLVSLPQPILILTPPTTEVPVAEETTEQEDDEPVVSYPKQRPPDEEYWAIVAKMQSFVGNSADPDNTDLLDVSNNMYLREPNGQRAILDAGAIPSILNVLHLKQQHVSESRQGQQSEAALQILSLISVSPIVRRHLATDDAVAILLDLVKGLEEGSPLLNVLFVVMANCCKNTKFRNLVVRKGGAASLVLLIKNEKLAESVSYVLWTLNRSEEATSVMRKHLLIEVPKYFQIQGISDALRLNLTRLLHSVALYAPDIRTQMSVYQVTFFCEGLGSNNTELQTWSAKAFTIYTITDELQKTFMSQTCLGAIRLVHTLESKDVNTVLAGLECIATIGQIPKLRDDIVARAGVLARLQNLWKHEDDNVRKGTLKVIGVLTLHPQCASWTIKQNLIPGLLEYLRSTDPDFIIYSAKAIGACCEEKKNLHTLMDLNGVRVLWSLMKSPFSGVQAASTRALVPFLKDPSSPAIVRTFVDGLDLLVDLLRSNDPEVQASACMAVMEVARDSENLAVMTDLGLVELLSRLLSTKLDTVRKPLADAIGVSANWANNRRRFGEEGAVDPLVSYLRPPSDNEEVHAATAKALKALSEDVENSNKLRHAGVVDYLLKMVESKDEELQMAAAVAIRNIRTNCVNPNTQSSL